MPFGDWCALTKIGDTELTTQFHDAATGDMKLFVDFTTPDLFETKLHQELLPRLANKRQQQQQTQMREAAQQQPLTPPPHHGGGAVLSRWPRRRSYRAPPAGGAVQRSASASHRISPAVSATDPAQVFVHNMVYNSSSINSGGGGGGVESDMYEDSAVLLP